MSYETLAVERRGHVGWLLFNRPERLNAMNNTMWGHPDQTEGPAAFADKREPQWKTS
jgi:hypothetical protein